MTAMYPSPAGATESLLPLTAWTTLVADNPVLGQLEPDVEALLVNRVGESREYFLAPIDACYETGRADPYALARAVRRRGCVAGDMRAFFRLKRTATRPLEVSDA